MTFKDPDVVFESILDAVKLDMPKSLEGDERDTLLETRINKIDEQLSKWIEYSEYITIEFDTDKGTAIVLENN